MEKYLRLLKPLCLICLASLLVGCGAGLAPNDVAPVNKGYSVLEGNMIRTIPDGATFRIPDSWLESKPNENLFLSREEISLLSQSNGFTSSLGESTTLNSILSLDFCVAHVGRYRWGSGTICDQVRLYISHTNPDEIIQRIETNAVKAALAHFDEADLRSEKSGTWQKNTLKYFLGEGHTLIFREIDFYIKACGDKTVMLVFIHSIGGDEYVGPILDSFQLLPQCLSKV